MQSFISQYGYIAVFVLMLAESACIPVPSEVIMMLGGALAAGAVTGPGVHTHPLLIGIVAAGVLGNVAGSYISWAVGKYAGQAAIHRWGRKIGIRDHEIDRATAWFERHGPAAVLVGRVIPVIRTFISLPAGFADMPAFKFGLYTTLGCIPWTAALGIAGYALGANWSSVANAFHGPTYAIAGVLVVGIVVAFVLHRRRRRAADESGPGGLGGPSGPGGSPGIGGHPGQAGDPMNAGPAAYGSPAPNPNGGWGPGGGAQPMGGGQPVGSGQSFGGAQPVGSRPDGMDPASNPWDPDGRQSR